MCITELLSGKSGSLSVGPHRAGDTSVRVDVRSYIQSGPAGQAVIQDAPAVLGEAFTRKEVLGQAAALLAGTEKQTLILAGKGVEGAELTWDSSDGDPTARICVDADGDISGLTNPIANVLPHLGDTHAGIVTGWRDGTRFAFLHPDLRGPLLRTRGESHQETLSTAESLLRYLGRTVTPSADPRGIGSRFVEPGVGRSCLVDFLDIQGHPELIDFSATGIGLTGYSANGFVSVGRHLDGKVALKRAWHRLRTAERLEAAGCRAASVAAILEIPGDEVVMLDGSRSPAVVMVRAFRSVLRVKQFDPVAGFYHSLQYGARVAALLLEHAVREASTFHVPDTAGAVAYASAFGQELELYVACENDLQRVLGLAGSSAGESGPGWARRLRQRLVAEYAPILFGLARQRVSAELPQSRGRSMSTKEYVSWFVETLGAQLARMRQIRFLHDYHHPGISRYRPGWLYTLVEHNVTLCAELADLETGVFIDRQEEEIRDSLQLTENDVSTLRANFDRFHERDVLMARRIARSLVTVAVLTGDLVAEEAEQILARYDEVYLDLSCS